MEKVKFKASSSDFNKISGSPISYWVSKNILSAFQNHPIIAETFTTRNGMNSGDNEKFIRYIWEAEINKIGTLIDDNDYRKWCLLYKGGDWRKWHGNCIDIINILDFEKLVFTYSYTIQNNLKYLKNTGAHWNRLSAGKFGARFSEAGILFEDLSPSIFNNNFSVKESNNLLSYCNSVVFKKILPLVSSGWKTETGHLKAIPLSPIHNTNELELYTNQLISISKTDWDSFETSWDFTSLPLLFTQYRAETLAQTYSNIRAFWQNQTDEMKRLEEENNRIFIDAYGLNDELTPDVPLKEITINCNPNYRYGDGETETLEGKLLFDTIQEFIHYAVGNMFGRYSLDKDGLILANQGEGLDDFLKQIPQPKYMPDSDNVLPIFGEGFKNWFSDDIATRFNEFLRISFGDEKFTENLAFIENTLADNKAGKNISEYFQKSFYNYHVRRFKKRPIYWQFESPKGSFKALIYMHRYKPDQVSVILNDYLREFNNKITHEIESNRSILVDGNDVEKIKAQKEIDRLNPILREITDWERDIIFPLAQARIEIDLDDGVKVNYPKFGKALTKIVGLDASE